MPFYIDGDIFYECKQGPDVVGCVRIRDSCFCFCTDCPKIDNCPMHSSLIV